MACYNAITGPDPCDCLFKKQWEWEEVVRFHTPGWETWAGPSAPLTDSRSQVLRNSGNAERPIALGLSPPIQSEQANNGSEGRALGSLLWIQRGTAERSRRQGGKKGKVT